MIFQPKIHDIFSRHGVPRTKILPGLQTSIAIKQQCSQFLHCMKHGLKIYSIKGKNHSTSVITWPPAREQPAFRDEKTWLTTQKTGGQTGQVHKIVEWKTLLRLLAKQFHVHVSAYLLPPFTIYRDFCQAPNAKHGKTCWFYSKLITLGHVPVGNPLICFQK